MRRFVIMWENIGYPTLENAKYIADKFGEKKPAIVEIDPETGDVFLKNLNE